MPDIPDSKVHAHPNVQSKKRTGKKGTSPYRHITTSPYAELAVTSNFTFLTGASHPDEYVYRAAELGYVAIAITDRNSLAGIVRAHVAAKDAGIPFVVGCRLELCDAETPKRRNAETPKRQNVKISKNQNKEKQVAAPEGPRCVATGEGRRSDRNPWESRISIHSTPAGVVEEYQQQSPPLTVLVYPTSRAAYGRLCRMLTVGKRRAEKGDCLLTIDDLLDYQDGILAIILPSDDWLYHPISKVHSYPITKSTTDATAPLHHHIAESLQRLRDAFDDDRLSLALTRLYGADDKAHIRFIESLSTEFSIPLVAVNDVYYHDPSRRALQDVLTCVRHHCTLPEAGFRLFPNGERYLKEPQEMVRLFAEHPEAIARTMEIAERALGLATKPRSHEATKGLDLGKEVGKHEGGNGYIAISPHRHIATSSGFSLDQLRYEYPHETCPAGKTPMEHLIELTWQGADERYPQGVPEKVRKLIEHEFTLIEQLQYAPYFLTVHDLVKFARSRGILCQGRGAAANSAVCYCLGVTSVDPDRINLLFERFVSLERNEPPDIDIDFEHERREEVIQYIYEKYGRDRAGLTAEVITYRRRSAVRDVGKALGLSLDAVDRIAKRVDHWELNPFADSEAGDVPAQLAALGFDPTDATVRHLIRLVDEVAGFPRHLSQHVGGFVMTEGPLCESVPIENAAMPNRTVIEWDKDDIEALGMLKVDVLGLGMLTCISKALEFINSMSELAASTPAGRTKVARDFSPWNEETSYFASGGRTKNSSALRAENEVPAANLGLKAPGNNHAPSGRTEAEAQKSEHSKCLRAFVPSCLRQVASWLTLASIPPEDPTVYDMMCKADTVGVFQIESRAQMTMLPRLRPRCFYDLVIEVAIVRPGPIIGDMVHPYLRRRNGEEKFSYPTSVIEEVLGKTLGVPLFQEQVMALAIKAAGFTAGEAERLRRAITAWTSKDDIANYPGRFIEGMIRNGYDPQFATWCFERLKGFSQYGFPESHAASFALLVYASAWIKCYYPAAFAGALLNSQPMGFYAPAQIIRDAQDHGVNVLPADVNFSEWDCTLEKATEPRSHGATKKNAESPKRRNAETSKLQRAFHEAAAGVDPGGVADRSRGLSEAIPPDQRHNTISTLKGSQNGANVDSAVSSTTANFESQISNFKSEISNGTSAISNQPRQPALRLGLRLLRGLRETDVQKIVAAVRQHGPFSTPFELWQQSEVSASTLHCLAMGDAFQSMGLDRQHALWEVQQLHGKPLPLFDQYGNRSEPRSSDRAVTRNSITLTESENPRGLKSAARKEITTLPNYPITKSGNDLPEIPYSQTVAADYRNFGFSLKDHPLSFLRELLTARGVITAAEAKDERKTPFGSRVAVAGLVLFRQRPGTARGVMFMTLEDESGRMDLIVRPNVYEKFRDAAVYSKLALAKGRVERQNGVVHVLATSFESLDSLACGLPAQSRDFR